MLAVRSVISADVNGKKYEFFCSPDSSIDDALEANAQHRTFLIGKKQEILAAQQAVQDSQKIEPLPQE